MLELFSSPAHYEFGKSETNDSIVRFLLSEKLCEAREDIGDGFIDLSELGKSILSSHNDDREQRAKDREQADATERERIKERKQDRRDKWLIGILYTCGGWYPEKIGYRAKNPGWRGFGGLPVRG